MKIVACADLHLNNSNFGRIDSRGIPFRAKDFMAAFDHVVRQTVDSIRPSHFVIVGDVYDNPSPPNPIRKFLNVRLGMLSDCGIKTHILVGNHDACHAHHALEPVEAIGMNGVSVYYSPQIIDRVECLMLMFPHSEAVERKEKNMRQAFLEFVSSSASVVASAKRSGKDVIFFGHFPVLGAKDNDSHSNARISDVNFSDLQSVGADYIVLGDYHARQAIDLGPGTECLYVGSLERATFGDIQSEKGFVVYDSNQEKGKRLSWVPYVDGRPFIKIDGILDDIRDKVGSAPVVPGKPAVVKIACVGGKDECRKFDDIKQSLKDMLPNEAVVMFEFELTDVGRKDRVDELRRQMRESGDIGAKEIVQAAVTAADDMLKEPADKEAARSVIEDIVTIACRAQLTPSSVGGRVRIHGMRLHNFQRYGDEKNIVEFDPGAEWFLSPDRELHGDECADAAAKFLSSIDVNAKRLISIVGKTDGDERLSNGSGKSSILEAVSYAFFGKLVREFASRPPSSAESTTSIVRTVGGVQSKEAYVDVLFSSDGQLWMVKRGRKISKSGGHSPILVLSCLSSKDVKSFSGHRREDADRTIAQLVRMDFDTCVNSILFGQHDAGSFISGTDKTRKDILIKILGLTVIFGCLEEARNRKRLKEKEIDALESQISALSKHVMSEAEMSASRKEMDDLDARMARRESETAAIASKIASMRQAPEIAARNSAAGEAAMHRQLLEQKREELKSRSASRRREEAAASAEKESKLRNHSRLESDRAKMMSELAVLEKDASSFDDPAAKKMMATIAAAKEAKPKRTSQMDGISKRLLELESERSAASTKMRERQGDVFKLDALRAKAAAGQKIKCPECQSVVTAAHIELKKAEKQAEIASLSSELDSILQKRSAVKSEENEVRAKIANIDEYVAKEAETLSSIRNHENKVARIAAIKSSVPDMDARITESKSDLDAAEKVLASLCVAVADMEKSVLNEIKPFEVRQSELDARCLSADAAAKKIDADIASLESDLSAAKLDGDKDIARRAFLDAQIGEAKRTLSAIGSKKSEMDLKSRELRVLLCAEDVFSQDGISVQIIDKYTPLLNQYIAEFLDVTSKGRILADVSSDKEKGDIMVNISGSVAPEAALASKGEQVRIRLAVELALGMLALSHSDSAPDFVCLDEIFSPVDIQGKEMVFDVIRKLQEHFRMVLVISHDPAVQQSISETIVVNKVSNVSTIEKQPDCAKNDV